MRDEHPTPTPFLKGMGRLHFALCIYLGLSVQQSSDWLERQTRKTAAVTDYLQEYLVSDCSFCQFYLYFDVIALIISINS